MPLVLAFDTATPLGSVAVVRDGQTLAELSARVSSRHGETLLPHVEQVLALAGVAIADVDVLAVGTGPGSFTGLRIALATAKGLALARPFALVGVSTLATLARGVAREGDVIVSLIDAHKGEVYGAAFEALGGGPLIERTPPFSVLPSAVTLAFADPIVCGDALRAFPAELAHLPGRRAPSLFDFPRAAALADEALRLFAARGPDDLATLEPVYVRGADTT